MAMVLFWGLMVCDSVCETEMRQRLSGQASAWDALVLKEGACATPFAHGVGWGDALCRGVQGVNGGNACWGQIPFVCCSLLVLSDQLYRGFAL